jgi:hypothetical protein
MYLSAWLVHIFFKMLMSILVGAAWLANIFFKLLDNSLVVSIQEPITPSGMDMYLEEPDYIHYSDSKENQTIEDLNDLFKGGDGGTTFKEQMIVPMKIDVVQVVKNTKNIGLIVVLNMFRLCPIIGILHYVMPTLENLIIPFLDGVDFTKWTNDFIIAAGKLATAKKAKHKFPDAFKKAQNVWESFQTIINQVAETAPGTIEILEIYLNYVIKPEGLAGFLDHQDMNIYIACARAIIGLKEVIYYGSFVFIPFGGDNNWILASISMVLPGTIVSLDDIKTMLDKHPQIYAIMREWFYGLYHRNDDDRVSAFKYGIPKMVNGCLERDINTVMVPVLTHAWVRIVKYKDSVKAIFNVCKQLQDSGINALIARPWAAINCL